MIGGSGKQRGSAVTRVLIVDDHPIVRQGYAQLISTQPNLVVCGESDNSQDALRKIAELRPDLAVIDISLKEGHGIDLIKQIKSQHNHIRMLVASMYDESLFAERALRAGASGYINKQEATDQLIAAIRQVLQGQVYLSKRMTERMLHRTIGSPGALDQSPIDTLSDRELEVFTMIGKGLATRQIAGRLELSPKTVETYRENIKQKLNLKNSTELTRQAVQWVLENG